MTVTPAELCNPNSSSHGTVEGGFRPPDSSTGGIPVSTIYTPVPRGTRQAKAAWLRTHLASGVLNTAEIAAVLEIRGKDVGAIAAGKIALANPSWAKLRELVGVKVH
jgi:hypothetical protein